MYNSSNYCLIKANISRRRNLIKKYRKVSFNVKYQRRGTMRSKGENNCKFAIDNAWSGLGFAWEGFSLPSPLWTGILKFSLLHKLKIWPLKFWNLLICNLWINFREPTNKYLSKTIKIISLIQFFTSNQNW